VPAKSLSTFTTELLALHGQNDQLRLMRPDEQRVALDRFADVDAPLERYREVRDLWLTSRRDLADRRAVAPASSPWRPIGCSSRSTRSTPSTATR
jgi:DNA repair protein RecN (Recombination protein N)